MSTAPCSVCPAEYTLLEHHTVLAACNTRRLIRLQCWPFTPDLQWQSRGQRRISNGRGVADPASSRDRGGHTKRRRRHVRTPLAVSSVRTCACPFDAVFVPLNHSGNPGVNGVSHRGGAAPYPYPCQSHTSPLGCHQNSGAPPQYSRGVLSPCPDHPVTPGVPRVTNPYHGIGSVTRGMVWIMVWVTPGVIQG